MTRKRILLVDDAETTLLLERIILSKSYDLTTARNGEDAVLKAMSEPPDLILLDVVMPVKGGLEACRDLRRCEETKNIPIIMVTTRGEADNIESAYRSGCTDYVTKPINRAELLTKIRNCIGE